jgi:hypothetical protein
MIVARIDAAPIQRTHPYTWPLPPEAAEIFYVRQAGQSDSKPRAEQDWDAPYFMVGLKGGLSGPPFFLELFLLPQTASIRVHPSASLRTASAVITNLLDGIYRIYIGCPAR